MKVLIVDDEIDLSLLLKSYFVRKNYEVTLAHSLADGISQLKSLQPDILVLDNNLPDGVGWKEAPAIIAAHPGLFIYLVSAYHPSVPQMPKGARFKILEKPISLQDFESHTRLAK